MSRISQILDTFTFPKSLAVVECCFTSSGVQYYLVLLEKKKSQVHLRDLRSDIFHKGSLEELKAPLLLLFTGKKVLSRKVSSSSGQKEEILIQKAFPNIPLNDLYFRLTEFSEEELVVSAIRKDTVREECQKFQKVGLRIIDIAIGEYTAWPLIAQQDELKFQWGYHNINIENSEINISENSYTGEVELFGERLPAWSALPFISGISTLASGSFYHHEEPVTTPRSDWKFYQLYQKTLMPGIASVFLILLISYGVFTYYYDKNNTLEQLTASYDDKLAERDAMKESYERKKQFLSINGGDRSAYAEMSDLIAGTVPKGLQLSEMTFNPLEKKLKQKKLVRFQRNILIVNGESDNYGSFRSWLKELNQMEWVNKVDILGYQEKNSRHQAEFSIKLELGS